MAPQKKNKKKRVPTKKVAKKNSASSKKAVKKTQPKAAAPKKSPKVKRRRARGKRENTGSVAFEPAGLGARSGGQSGDLQGLTNFAGADSESVDELLEEGNALEAEVVKGVEDAPDPDVSEVKTHEFPEEDVPEEYLDQDEQA